MISLDEDMIVPSTFLFFAGLTNTESGFCANAMETLQRRAIVKNRFIVITIRV
jgi:hypothetical protein